MIIGICGFKGAGKDTLAKFFVDRGFKKMSFAEPVKDIASILFGWDRKMLEGDTIESRKFREDIDNYWSNKLDMKMSPRIALQKLGTDVFRENFHDDFWVKILESKIKDNKNIVISDCRFPNEIKMIKENNGIIIHIYKDIPKWFEPYRTYKIIKPEVHPSEYMWVRTNFDYVIKNDGDIENLEFYVDKILEENMRCNIKEVV